MDKQMATRLNQVLVGCYADLHRTIDLARHHRSDQDFRVYCRAVAGALGHMLLDLMDPLYEKYPDLVPDFLLRSEDDASDLVAVPPCDEPKAKSTPNDIGARTKDEACLSGLLDHVVAELRSAAELVANEADHVRTTHHLQEIQCALGRVLEVRDLVADVQPARCADDVPDR